MHGTLDVRTPRRWSASSRGRTEQSYWTHREPLERPDWERYWLETRDPDGAPRERFSRGERARFLEYRAEEIEFVNLLPGGWLCDVGCGPGWLLDALGPQWTHNFGVDVSQRAVEIAQQRGHIVYLGELAELPFDNPCFQCITHLHVIEHVPDPIAEICAIRRLLCRGGWLVIATPDFDSPCAQRFGNRYRMLCDSTHRNLFDRAGLERMLLDYGFRIDRVRYPFPDSLATPEIFARWNDAEGVSPPWPGNWMTFYARLA